MSSKQRHLLLGCALLLLLILLGCWGLYLRTQAILSHQLAHLAEQSLPSDGPTPSLRIGSARATGWPFGAWRKLSNVSFHTHLNGAEIAGATSSLTLGGNWLDWARALTTQDKLPLHMPQVTVLRLVRGGDSLTLRLHNMRLRISKGSTPCPAASISCPAEGDMPLYRAHFHLNTLEMASSRLPYSLTLHHPAGAIRFAPQSLSLHDPALQDRALLSAALTASTLTSPAALLQDFQIKDLRSNFALLPSLLTYPPASSSAYSLAHPLAAPPPYLPATPPAPAARHLSGAGRQGHITNRHNDTASPIPSLPEPTSRKPQLQGDLAGSALPIARSPWPTAPLRLRLHELSATIQPLAPEEQGPPAPRLSLGGELYVPAFSGTLSVMLTNWESPLHILLQSVWFQQLVPPSTQALLHELMTSPKLEALATKPLMISLPLDHGLPPALTSGKLRSLYDHLRQIALPPMASSAIAPPPPPANGNSP